MDQNIARQAIVEGNNPFGRPVSTQCSQRVYKPSSGPSDSAGWGHPAIQSCLIAPQGKGGHCIEYQKPAGHSIGLMFAVDAANTHADFFKLFKSGDDTTKTRIRVMITDTDGKVLGTYEPGEPAVPGQHPAKRGQTDTDQPHGWYVAEGNQHNSETLALKPGMYIYWFDTADGAAATVPVWHQGN